MEHQKTQPAHSFQFVVFKDFCATQTFCVWIQSTWSASVLTLSILDFKLLNVGKLSSI
jgi:hypothetical protein